MKILVITRNAWEDTNAIGNTMSNFFSNIDAEYANVFFRSASPSNGVCSEYYRVTETEILKKLFCPAKIGEYFSCAASFSTVKTSTQKNEKAIIRFIRKHNLGLAYRISDRIWYGKKWQNENLKRFVENFSPDIAVTFVKSSPQYYLMVKYLRENFNIPVFSWIADDEYTELSIKKSYKKIRNLKYILDESAMLKGCSQQICDYYNSVFGCKATPLYKSCDLSMPVKNYINKPLKIVYSGNLLYGRMEIIRRVSQILQRYDCRGEKVSLEVYSNTPLSENEAKIFDDNSCVHYHGCIDYSEIKQKLSAADLVLHVESFEDTQILKTKYSFSTKIIDYLQSGSVILAVGPGDVASIEYIKQIPGSYVIDDEANIDEQIVKILENCTSLLERANTIREFARKNHDQVICSKKLEGELKAICRKES